MRAVELRKKTLADLQEELLGLLREQFNLRMQHGSGQLSQNHRVKEVRRNIARVHTVMKQKKAGETS